MGETDAHNFEDAVVEYLIPDREALVQAVNKLLWEKGGHERPAKLRELENGRHRGLRALLIYMSYRKGGIRKAYGVGAAFKEDWVSLYWKLRGSSGYLRARWPNLAARLNEPLYAESHNPEELADLVIETIRELVRLARPGD